MANAKGAKIDTTQLSVETATERGFLHRDYIAHCFRWSHVIKFLQQSKRYSYSKVLDIGCGEEVPLAKSMYSSKMTNVDGGVYVGVDINLLPVPDMLKGKKFNIELRSGDVCLMDDLRKDFDVVVSFEVLEHVEPEHMVRMLRKVQEVMTSKGTFIMSTPCYDEFTGAADNHVNEIKYMVLGSLLEHMGFDTTKRYGTFASQKDYKVQLEREHPGIFDRLGEFYDSNVLATIFAPLYPQLSRNCLWELTLGSSVNFPSLRGLVDGRKVLGSTSVAEWNKALSLLGVERDSDGKVV